MKRARMHAFLEKAKTLHVSRVSRLMFGRHRKSERYEVFMEMIYENATESSEFKQSAAVQRIEALKTLTKLLLREVESLEETSPFRSFQTNADKIDLSDQVQRYEAALICKALLSANGNQRKAAAMLSMKTTTLHAKIKRYEIDSFGLAGKIPMSEFSNENV